MEIKKIETYSLYEFCQSVQECIDEGYRFDFDSNENFPTAYGTMLVAGMVKAEVKLESKPVVELKDNTENNTEVKRGRKPKDNT